MLCSDSNSPGIPQAPVATERAATSIAEHLMKLTDK